MSYIGSTPTTQSFIAGTDYFNGTGSQTAFTLSRSVVSVNDIEVVINNVEQQPNTAYTVSGTTITFTSAPSAGTGNIYIRYLSTTTQSITPSQNTVSYSTLNSDNQSKLGISFKNRIINGAMVIDQRNAGASVTGADANYAVDRYQMYLSNSTGSKGNMQQNQGSVTPPVGFTNYLGFTTTSAYSVGTLDGYALQQRIEGYNMADFGWGTANAKTVTLSFWAYSSLTGTFGGAIANGGANYAYPFSYSIPVANTWTQISVTIAGATSGTWLTTNGIGAFVSFSLGTGTTYSGTAGAWTGSFKISATGATSVVGTNGATFYLTGVQLEVGTQATTFDYRSYGTELALCQRYYEQTSSGFANPMWSGNATNGVVYYANAVFLVQKRAAPTIVQTSVSNSGFPTTNSSGNITTTSFYEARTANSTANGSYFASTFTASAEL